MEIKFKIFKKAVTSLDDLVSYDLSSLDTPLDEKLIDGIENGVIQKFEYAAELSWKTIKKILKEVDGIIALTPKDSIKSFYTSGHINEDTYLLLLNIIDDRNKLSHIYDEKEFKEILKKMKKYISVFKKLLENIEILLHQNKDIK